MRVEASSASYLYTASLRATERAREITATAAQAANAPQEAQAPRENRARQADLTSMTLEEMMDWVNEQFFKGEIKTPEEMSAFVVLFVPCWLDEISGRVDLARERYDFMQMAHDHLSMARASGEKGEKAAALLEKVLSIMQRCQGQNVSVDTFA